MGPVAPTLLDAVGETIEIGERTGARVVASHLKAKGEHYWGSSAAAVNLIQRARDRGVDVWADQYPYPTSGTDGATVLVPAWATRVEGAGPQAPGSRAAVLKRVLGDPPTAKLVRSDIAHEIRRRGGPEHRRLRVHRHIALWKIAGRNRQALETRRGRDRDQDSARRPARARRRRAHARVLHVGGGHGNHCQAGLGSDLHRRRHRPVNRWSGHPCQVLWQLHSKIRHYALDRGAISLEHAIRASTSLPARIMRLGDRGQIRDGMAADIVVFDVARIRDKATFFEPHQHSDGVEHVFVNGVARVRDGAIVEALPGPRRRGSTGVRS